MTRVWLCLATLTAFITTACSKSTSEAPAPAPEAAPAPATTAADAATTFADPAVAPLPARPVPPIGVYTDPVDALVSYLEGKRAKDPLRLWSVMPAAAQKILQQGFDKARGAATDAQLAKVHLTREMLDTMTLQEFFGHMVHDEPSKDIDQLSEPAHDFVLTPDSPSTVRIAFKIGAFPCQGYASQDPEGWKIQLAQCNRQ